MFGVLQPGVLTQQGCYEPKSEPNLTHRALVLSRIHLPLRADHHPEWFYIHSKHLYMYVVYMYPIRSQKNLIKHTRPLRDTNEQE
jgi:hypothetical protein